MKQEKYTRKDGTEGHNNIPEAGDMFIAKYPTVRSVKTGLYENHSLGVFDPKDDKEETIYLKITPAQKMNLEKHGDITGKTVEFYQYTNEYGDQVGATVKKEEEQ
jgi:hypothetical protein